MNLDNLACFVEVAQTGSITETARRRFTSQQAVSDQIRRLEAYYQTPLLERTRPLGLTAAGKLVYETAREVMGTMERLKERVERLRREEDRLVICTGMAATPPFLPDLMMRFQQEMPEVEMTLIHPQNTSAVLTTPPPEADLLIGNLPFDHDVEAIELLRDPFSVVASDALLTRIFGPAWEEAELGEADWCRVPFQITRKTEREALSWAPLRDQVIHADSLDLVLFLCREGKCASVFPHHFACQVFAGSKQMHIFPIRQGAPAYCLGVGLRREETRSRAVEGFLRLARAYFAEQGTAEKKAE